MEQVFQNYDHYTEWLTTNWKISREMDALIIKNGLIIERQVSANGEPYRRMNREEFLIKESASFIKIPVLTT